MPTIGHGQSLNFFPASKFFNSGCGSSCPIGHLSGVGYPRPSRLAPSIRKKGAAPVTVLQVWLVVAVPALVLAFTLFYGRSKVRTLLGYLVLAVAFGVVVMVDRASGALIGGLAALLYGAGRGGQAESEGEDTSTIAVPDETRRTARFRAE
jgi:polyferredoxin